MKPAEEVVEELWSLRHNRAWRAHMAAIIRADRAAVLRWAADLAEVEARSDRLHGQAVAMAVAFKMAEELRHIADQLERDARADRIYRSGCAGGAGGDAGRGEAMTLYSAGGTDVSATVDSVCNRCGAANRCWTLLWYFVAFIRALHLDGLGDARALHESLVAHAEGVKE